MKNYVFRFNKQMKTEKKVNSVNLWLKFILIFIISFVIIVLIALSPLFNVNSIEVYGNKHYENSEIIDGSLISGGTNAFKVIGANIKSILNLRCTNAEINIMKFFPYAKNVVVKYKLPNKVEITIEERVPLALIPYMGTSLVIDQEGYVVDTQKNEQKYKLPLIKSLKFDNYELGQKLEVHNNESLNNAIKVLNEINLIDKTGEFKLLDSVNSIDAGDAGQICMFIDSRIAVNLGDLQDLTYKIRFLKQIYYKNIGKNEKGLIDFSTLDNPVFIPDKFPDQE